jgi:hypothetical protein
MRWRLTLGGGVLVALAWSEWMNWRWSRTLVGTASGGSEAVLVLGYRNPQPAANVVNRWRVRAGIRSLDGRGRSCIVFSGGSSGGGPSEAALMADYAARVLGRTHGFELEENSGSTWENVANSIPLLEGFDRIKVVSNPPHALKARAYLWRQRPELAQKLVRSGDYRFGEHVMLKPILACYGLWTLGGLTPAEGQQMSLRSALARHGLSLAGAGSCPRPDAAHGHGDDRAAHQEGDRAHDLPGGVAAAHRCAVADARDGVDVDQV